MNRLLSFLTLPLVLLGTAAAAQSPVITFKADWTLSESAPLTAVGDVQIAYDIARLPQCRSTLPDGTPGWSLTGHYRFTGATISDTGSFDVAGQPSTGIAPALPLREAGLLELWFHVRGENGCEAWDSNFGTNFRFDVHLSGAVVPPTIVFQDGWVENVVGTLKQGKPFVVDYDLDRLPECRLTYNGGITWAIAVQYRFDNDPTVKEAFVSKTGGYSSGPVPATITPPAGARSVTMWFKNWDRGSCVRWDSQYGANYHFTLQP